MDFVTQFENTLEQTIAQNLLPEANQLLAAYPATGQPYTLRLLSMINDLRRKTHPFRLPMEGQRYRIVLFRTGNFILDYILEQFSSFFLSQNCDIFIFDCEHHAESSTGLFAFARSGIDAAFFFNNVGLLQTLEQGDNLWETLHIPCYDFLVDHPMYYADSLDFAPADTTLLCADQTHANYALRFYGRLKDAVFLPTGGCEAADVLTKVPEHGTPSYDAFCQRPMDVLFIGSYKYHSDTPSDAFEKDIIRHLQSHTDHTFEQAVEACAKESGKTGPTTDAELKQIIEKYRFTETNLTALYRKSIMKALLDAKITVHVYGNGWAQSGLTAYENFVLHAPVSFEEGIKLMSQTKILLNHMAWFKHGSSERIFNAMAQGAVCVTDSSEYLDTILTHGENCCIYDIRHPENGAVAREINHLLSDPQNAARIAANGQQIAAEHTWKRHLLSFSFI